MGDEKEKNQSLIYSSIVAIVAVVGLVMLFSGTGTGAQTVEVYNPMAGGGQQCARMITPAGYVIDCGAGVSASSFGFGTPSKQADQFREQFIQGSFEVGSGVSAYGAVSRGRSFGPSREFIEGAIEGTNCWQEAGATAWVCTGY